MDRRNSNVVELYTYNSLFLFVASEADIEAERMALEAAIDRQLQIYRVSHQTRSGARVTVVEWEVL